MATIALPRTVWIIFHVLCLCGLLLCGITDIYYLAKLSGSWSIRTGYTPDNTSNISFYNNISILVWCVFAFLFAIFEFCLLISIGTVKKFRIPYMRSVSYILLGIAELGVCGDLGIASGSIIIILGGFYLVLDILATAGRAAAEE